MAICEVDLDALYQVVNEHRQRRGKSWRQVAADLELPPGTFTRLNRGKGVSVDTFVSLLYWLGTIESVEPFLKVPGEMDIAC